MNQKKQNHALTADLLLATVAVIWGLGFPIVQVAIDAQIGAGMIVALRFWVASLAMGLAFWRELRTLTWLEVKLGAAAGILLSLSFLLQTVGQKYTTPSNTAFLTSLNVVLVPLLSWGIFKQRPTRKILGVGFCCLLGATVLTITPGQGLVLTGGDLLVLCCALGFSLHVAYLGTIAGRIGTQKLTFLQMFFAALVATGYLLVFERPTLTQGDFTKGFPAILYLGLLSTAYSFFAQTYAQKHTSAAKAAIILGTEGLLGSIFSVLLGYEVLTTNLLVGGTIIFLAMLAMELDVGKLLGRNREKPLVETVPFDSQADQSIQEGEINDGN